jgi:predicted amidohydrolase YtcJ
MAPPPAVDLVLVNGKVWDGRDLPGVDAVAIGGGRIVERGAGLQMAALAPGAEVIDVGGRRIMPGLIDSHLHMVRAGLRWNDLVRWNEVGTLALALQLISNAAAERRAGSWIAVLGGWHPMQFDEERPPTRSELDHVAPDHPVYVQRGYTEGFLNTRALDAIDFGDGAVVHREQGRVAGQAAIAACNGRLEMPEFTAQVEGTRAMLAEFNRLGLTGAIDAGGFGMSPELYEAMFEVHRTGGLSLRTRLLIGPGRPGGEEDQLARWMEVAAPGSGDDRLGYLGAGEVFLFAAHDMEGLDGRDIRGQREPLSELFSRLTSSGWPVHVHAILDRSVGTVLDALAEAQRMGGEPLRSAVTHADQISAKNLRRLFDMGLGLTIQNGLAFRGADSVATWGEDRVAASPPLRDMLDLGIPLGAGTDGTVAASCNPWTCLAWLVTGRPLDGGPVRAEEHRLTRDEALSLYTSGSAWFSSEETTRGNLEPGSFADVIVLSADFLTVDERRLGGIEADLTIVGGRVVHGGDGLGRSTT